MEIVDFVFNLLVYIINTVIYLLAQVLNVILSVLPSSPFSNLDVMMLNSDVSKYLPYLAWLLPIKEIIIVVTGWLGAMLIYYFQSVIMRWIKMIE